MGTVSPLMIAPEDCVYNSCYCEENVYKLIGKLVSNGYAAHKDLWAVFISNPAKVFPLFKQKNSSKDEGLAFWDYHVILVHCHKESEYIVWDLDSTLEFPCPLDVYVASALQESPFGNLQKYDRWFRVVDALTYIEEFASDRSHMINSKGFYNAPPPEYPCITAKDGKTMTLPLFWNMNENQDNYGKVMDEKAFKQYFYQLEKVVST